ncbi:MAG: fumarylacetoacetate hydrolase family protein [Pseudomonadota bacterium]
MRLLTFEMDGKARLGVQCTGGDNPGGIVDLAAAAPALPSTWPEILDGFLLGDVEAIVRTVPPGDLLDEGSLTYLAPIVRPPKLLCVGLNYHSHAAEVGLDAPEHPIFFVRFPTSITGHRRNLVRPTASEQFDYEAELAVVIGKGGRHISNAAALDHVAGYSICNDGSLRDFQFRGGQWTLGKNFDASGSLGPVIVTADELPLGAAGLQITCRLNDQVVQDSNTSDMIFDVPALIEAASQVMTLEPGDVIITGTPPGVGVARKPPLWMKPGDRIEVNIEDIGSLTNPIVDAGTLTFM